jgi:signal transduction histidine kinase
MSSEADKWKKRFERERESRKAAEKLLENKSEELYQLNQQLETKIAQEVEKSAQKERMLFQQSKMASMGEMISNIAHQWRQPLQAIGIVTQKLQIVRTIEGSISQESVDDIVAKVGTQLEYLTNTIEDFRSFFTPDKERTHFEIEDSIQKVISLLDSTLKSSSIIISQDLEKIYLYNLENEFIQVLLNIIKNAIDVLIERHIDNKLILVHARIIDKKFIKLKILDNAGGVPNKIKDNIFEPYFTTKHKSQGTGLGLYMSHEIISKHMKGNLTVENEEYNFEDKNYTGASFNITIPINPEVEQ